MLFPRRWMMVTVSMLVILGAFFGATVGAYFLGGLAEGWFKGGSHLTNILILVLVFVMVIASLLTAAERKWSSMMQNRIGPNRARIALPGLKNNSLGGIPHFLADGAKMLFKEDFMPAAAKSTRLLFELAPILAFVPALMLFAVVPAGPTVEVLGREVSMIISNPDFGILWVFAIASLAVYGTALAGWASNNKFALLGGVRASSQMISYEVALGLGLVGMMMAFSTVQLTEMTAAQSTYLWRLPGDFDIGLPAWGIFLQPIGFILFFAASFAETKRTPFDLPEGESEVIGYFVEYSGMKFGFFMISEFAEIVVLSGVITAIFLGGYHLPFGEEWLAKQAIFEGRGWLWGGLLGMVFWFKVLILCWVQLLIRWTMVRFRYDQVQALGWKILLPAGLVNVFVTGALVLWDPSLRALALVGLATLFAIIAITWMGGGAKEEAHDHGGAHGAGGQDDHGHAAPAAAAHP